MNGVTRKLGLAAAAVALAAVALWLVVPALTDEATAPPPPAEASRPTAKETDASRSRRQAHRVPPRTVVASRPGRSPVAWVREGRRVEVRTSPGGKLVGRLGEETEFGSPTVLAVLESRPGWIGVPTPLRGNEHLGWIKLDPSRLRTGTVGQSIVVDLSERSARLRRGKRVVRSWTVTVGAPGSETPAGSFAVTDTFRGELNPAYGCCAVALTARQPDLLSGWAGGDRIAFHGTSGPLGVAASHGCLRSADRDVSFLVRTVALGTPVTIRK